MIGTYDIVVKFKKDGKNKKGIVIIDEYGVILVDDVGNTISPKEYKNICISILDIYKHSPSIVISFDHNGIITRFVNTYETLSKAKSAYRFLKLSFAFTNQEMYETKTNVLHRVSKTFICNGITVSLNQLKKYDDLPKYYWDGLFNTFKNVRKRGD